MQPWSIQLAAADQLPSALAILHGTLPPEEARSKVQADLQRIQAQHTDTRAMVVAVRHANARDSFVGACWIEIQPGHTGFVHPPVVLWEGDEQHACQRDLFQAAAEIVATNGVTWLQSLLPSREPVAERFLVEAGFTHFSALSYQVCLAKMFPATEPSTRFSAIPYRPEDRVRLAQVVTATYQGSLDSPALDGERSSHAALASYESIGNDGASHWQLLVQDGQPIGCLLLAVHRPKEPRARPFGELVYWGLIPSARGQGLGREIVALALWQMHSLGMEKLLLAVDERNTPALRIYEQLGFFGWLVRHAWGKALLTP